MKRLLIISAALLLMGACTPRLVILHCNDTHSHFEPARGEGIDGQGGCIEMAAYVDSVRLANGEDKVLLLHAGDFSQGTSYFTKLGGTLEIDMLNALRFDCVALGNHEFDNGIEDLAERIKNLECPCVCANLDLSTFELGRYVKPFAIIEKAGMKIGVIGLEADISTCVAKSISSRIPQLDNVEVVNRYSEQLHGQGCDMIVLLSHLGWQEDHDLVPQTKWLDLVVGGHSHVFIEDMDCVRDAGGRKVPIVTDGCWGLKMGELSIY